MRIDNRGMRFPWFKSALCVTALLLTVAALAKDKKSFDPPSAYHANSYPARTFDTQEHVTIAADPYDMPDKAAVFAADYANAGLLPVRIIVSNDSDTVPGYSTKAG